MHTNLRKAKKRFYKKPSQLIGTPKGLEVDPC
jgi:hypothetical protein